MRRRFAGALESAPVSAPQPGLPAGDRPYDEKRLPSLRNGFRQEGVRQLIGQVTPTREESQERPAPPSDRIANGAPKLRIPGLDRVDQAALGRRAGDLNFCVAAHASEGLQVGRKPDPDHENVCTSTESTAGRSRTTGAQLSPPSVDAYTCPPVVPKYTPHPSSESTAMASRSTFT